MTIECQAPDCKKDIQLRGPWEAKRRKYCSSSCSASGQVSQTKERIDEIKWIGSTDHPESIAQRLGFSGVPHMLEMLMRNGEHELATRLRAAHARYMGPMVDDEVFA